ncbi:MAG: hypothetical protein WDA09_01445 [Bacteriovoracaceae bacterium]
MTFSKFKKIIPFFTALFIIYFLFALYKGLTGINWGEVKASLALLDETIIFQVGILAFLNLMILMSFDQLAITYISEKVSRLRVAIVALISYVLNLNFGAILGSVGVRYRLYSKIGVQPLKIHLIVIFSSLSNWVAYLFIFGLIILISPPVFLSMVSASLVKFIAFAALTISFLYLIACFKGLSFNINNSLFKLPTFKLGVAQVFFGCLQWSLQGLMIYQLFSFFNIPFSYYEVLTTFLVAAIAGVLTHIPSGLGVLEAIFLSLTPTNYHPQVLASLVCFRAIFYLFPLSLALPSYIYFETKRLFQSTNQH